MCSSVWDLLTGPASVLSLLSGICPHSPLELLGSLRWSLLSQRWPGSLGRESHSPHQPPARPGPCPRSGYIHSSRSSQLNGGEKLFKMNSTDGVLPALNCRILFPCCCVSPVSCRFVCKLSKRPVFHRVWRLLPRARHSRGRRTVCQCPRAGPRCRPWPAERAVPTDVPTCPHTARPLVSGQEPARLPRPAPQPTSDYACLQRSREKLHKLRPQIALTSFHLRVRMAP